MGITCSAPSISIPIDVRRPFPHPSSHPAQQTKTQTTQLSHDALAALRGLENMRELDLRGLDKLTDATLEAIVARNGATLQTLRLRGCRGLTNEVRVMGRVGLWGWGCEARGWRRRSLAPSLPRYMENISPITNTPTPPPPGRDARRERLPPPHRAGLGRAPPGLAGRAAGAACI